MTPVPPSMDALFQLEMRTGSEWAAIHTAAEQAETMRSTLNDSLEQFTTKDSSIVVVGSLARQEFTSSSDIDWMLLLDGLSDPNHALVATAISKEVARITETDVGPEGYFGAVCPGHDLIHYIGGQGDTNANTTRRILLLLESVAIGKTEAHSRVVKNVLSRYLAEDRGLWHGSSPYKVPRFLFNDISRYWRTMAVDFSYKQRTRPGGDFALKNFKLRMSRRLIYLAGMLACFECHLGFSGDDQRQAFYAPQQLQPVIERVFNTLRKPPLEIVASVINVRPELDQHSKAFFGAYNEFLSMLADDSVRDQLKKLDANNLDDPLAKRYRDVAHRFMDAIRGIFLTPTNQLGQLTIEYGVF